MLPAKSPLKMPGLDRSLIDDWDWETSLARILTDVRTDFILAPHLSAVYAHMGAELADEATTLLASGTYEPSLPITIEVPKRSGLTRPGSILVPLDRLVYQGLIDMVARPAESALDRDRVFSHALASPFDEPGLMFQPTSSLRSRMQARLKHLCEDDAWTHVLKADVASYFEGLYQHNLINLLNATDAPSGAVNLLEKVLAGWQERASHGILQGMFPSDFMGTFYLHSLDSDLATRDIPSVRFVDDLYLFFGSEAEARRGLVDLCRTLRNEGLHLNEAKTAIVGTDRLLREETALDEMFTAAREEVEAEALQGDWYSFQITWMPEEEPEEEELELMATEALYDQIGGVETPFDREKIEKFCLPVFAAARSTSGVDRSLTGIIERPHLTQLYASYLGALVDDNPEIVDQLSDVVNGDLTAYDWQLMWVVGALLRAPNLRSEVVDQALRTLRNSSRSQGLRAVCALVVGRHGHAGQRRNLRHWYADEPSDYVRAAIVYAARYLPSRERSTAVAAWSGHSRLNALVGRAAQEVARSPDF